MSNLEKLQEQLSQLMLEQSESLSHRTFLGINEEELKREDERIRRIRELSAALLKAMHHRHSPDGGASPSHHCEYCEKAARRALEGEKR
jgi:hypothetical protein